LKYFNQFFQRAYRIKVIGNGVTGKGVIGKGVIGKGVIGKGVN
jgi:hypothetical protein